MINKIKYLFSFALLFACGGQDPDEALLSQPLAQVCKHNHSLYDGTVGDVFVPPELEEGTLTEEELAHGDVEKAVTFWPFGYGIDFATGTRCVQPLTNKDCWVPWSKTFNVKVMPDGQDALWIASRKTTLNNMVTNMNAIGWQLTSVEDPASAEYRVRTGTVSPDGGYLGASEQTNLVIEVGANNFRWIKYTRCDAWLYRTAIEANQFYQAASSAAKQRYIKNLQAHEMQGHCLGLAHPAPTVVNTLMSQNYTYPGPMFDTLLQPTVQETTRQQTYVP